VFIMNFAPGHRWVECAYQLHFGARLERMAIMLVQCVHGARLDFMLFARVTIDDGAFTLVTEHGFQMVFVPHVAFQPRWERRFVKRVTHTVLGQQPANTGPAIGADYFTVSATQIFGADDFHGEIFPCRKWHSIACKPAALQLVPGLYTHSSCAEKV